jgi:hypothetical protein
MAIQEPRSRSQHKKRRNLWIALGALGGTLILILVVIVTVLVVSSNHPATSVPPAEKETRQEGLTAYATDLQHGNYHEAYKHLSTNYTLQLNANPKTEAAFTATESAAINPRGGLKTFKISTLFLVDVGDGSTNSGAKGSLDYTFADGSTTRVFFLLTLENNHWKILSENYQVKP